ncbi:MAG TPA: MBL fold metallo-hydrolase [Deltaproteobacteria bacterium]|nr:MBL fold metallo-hydrolase [Deltaproteobacteria bacterium]HOM29588.1 MBL fold metallo-hydrolase [Deltaproteobacteria bacterium]HPP81369.1 MBL fold metallo-hydrolase [Deltaproteobacteria bacterium]
MERTRLEKTTGSPTRVTFLGSGDAFGSGGRLPSAVHVGDGERGFLVDCGPAVLPAMRRSGVEPSTVELILISHLHGDHLGGVPFFLLEEQLASARQAPLVIAGPEGVGRVVSTLAETLFPGFSTSIVTFPLSFVELRPLVTVELCGVGILPFPAIHSAASNPLSLRVETGSRVIAYSGDTEWHDGLIEASRGADLFICECFSYHGPKANHLDHSTLVSKKGLIDAKRIVIVHMDETMLARTGSLAFEPAFDGMVIEL